MTPVSQNPPGYSLSERFFATATDHNSASHTSALASMIASENLTFTRDVSTKTRSASTGAPNPPPCFLTGRRRGRIRISRQDSGSARHARQLYDAGYAAPESLVEAGEGLIWETVGPKITRNGVREVEMGDEIGGT